MDKLKNEFLKPNTLQITPRYRHLKNFVSGKIEAPLPWLRKFADMAKIEYIRNNGAVLIQKCGAVPQDKALEYSCSIPFAKKVDSGCDQYVF